jgi:hypothetical protein
MPGKASLRFAVEQPRVYEAMFSMPSGLKFGTGSVPDALQRAFAGIRDAFPGGDAMDAEMAWATVHGLATLEIGKRLLRKLSRDRLRRAVALLDPQPSP